LEVFKDYGGYWSKGITYHLVWKKYLSIFTT
jgi:hypothetical protein